MDERQLNPEGYSWTRKDRYEKEDRETLKCAGCGFSFFEEIKINRFKEASNGIIGQGHTKINVMDFPAYRCMQCGKIHLPPDDGSSTGRQWELYRQLADAIDPVDPNAMPNVQEPIE